MQLLLFWIIFLTSFYGESQEIYPWEIRCIEGTLNAAKALGANKSCESGSPQSFPQINPQCSDLTDDLCKALWSDKNKGNLKVGDGVILAGQSAKSKMAASRLEDLRALVDSESKLPSDLRKKAKPILSELKDALAKERDSEAWYGSLSLIISKWDRALTETSIARTEAQHPNLKSIDLENLSIEQSSMYRADEVAVQNQVLEAKYKQHPNWKRVERVMEEARQDIQDEIRKFNIPSAQKEEMMARVAEMKLTLPYFDPTKTPVDEECGSTQLNAFYSKAHTAFTVCAGFFNSFQSDSIIYGTIAHEISHSIDPVKNAWHQVREKSSLYKSLNRLVGAAGPVLPCSEWEQIAENARKAPPTSIPITFDSMQVLYNCLQATTKSVPFDQKTVDNAAKRIAKQTISDAIKKKDFMTIAQPTITKNGKKTPNQFFMRPDRFIASKNNDIFVTNLKLDASVEEIFTQSLSCMKITDGSDVGTYQNATAEQRSKVFDKALAETSLLVEAQTREWFSYCGRNCPELTGDSLSTNSSERFADWMEYKAINNYLTRNKNLRESREASALASADLCDRPGLSKDAPDLAAAQTKYSLESYPDNRGRRISLFSKKNAELNQCRINEKQQGFGLCEL